MNRERSETAGAQGDLGAEPSRFVGRAPRLDALAAALDGARLVTVTGTAGVGKTRLALEHARRRAPVGGALRIDLAAARSGADVAEALRSVLGATGDGIPTLGAALRARGAALLILDGCEHVVAPVAATVGALLSRSPALRCLATSRRPLRLPGEQLFALEPLKLPEGPDEVETAEASALFLDRARLEVGALAFDGEGARAVVEIVARLGGLPLGIELCASRLQVMTLSELARELSRGLAVLDPTPRDGAPGPPTLRRAFASSWDLLSPWERSALAQASVFRGGFSLAAAARVVDLSDPPGAPPFLDVLQALVDQSLIARRALDGGRQLEFRLHESVRHFAAEALGEGAAGALDRHARYFLDRAEEVPLDGGDGDARTLGETDGEELVAALEHALAGPRDPALGRRLLAGALAADAALVPRGAVAARRALLDASLDAAVDAGSGASAMRALALLARAEVHAAACHPLDGHADRICAKELLALAPAARLRAEVAVSVARDALSAGQLDEARTRVESALGSRRALGDRRAEAEALLLLAQILRAQGEHAAASDSAERAATAARAAGCERLERLASGALGVAAHELGELSAAERHYRHALDGSRARRDRTAEAALSTCLGVLALERGALPEAAALLERARAAHVAAGDRALAATALDYLGLAEEAQGIFAAARGRYEEAATLHQEGFHAPHGGLNQAWLGRLLASCDHLDDARRALDEARSRVFSCGSRAPLTVYDLCEGHFAVAEARAARARGDEHTVTACLARARQTLADPDWGPPSIDVRLAHAALSSALERESGAPPARSAPETSDLVISASALWFQLPAGPRVSLGTRRALRAILRRLAEEREARPGEPLELPALLDAGWPGERVLHEAGASRVYAAVAHLRRDGLRDVLIRRDDGYLLDPAVGLAREPD
jgi:predicted ATPase